MDEEKFRRLCELDKIHIGDWTFDNQEEWQRLVKEISQDMGNEILKLRAQLEQYRWIPVSERLPEFMYGGKVGKKLASRPVDIAYRYKSENRYFSTRSQFLREYGWVLEFVQGQPKTFEDYGYIIDFWREIGPLPTIQDVTANLVEVE